MTKARHPARALVVDDEPDIPDLIRITLARMGIDSHCVGTLQEARHALAERPFDLCLTDMRLPDGDGTDLVRQVSGQYPDMPIAMVTAHGNMESAVAAMKAGAFDFVSKPLDLRALRELTKAALRARAGNAAPLDQQSSPATRLIGQSARILELRVLIAKLARNQAPVFISGESGTGKELAASLIHQLGPRAAQPFVPVNCGAIPGELVESELFGHRKGSFTGAISDKPGLFQSAQGGTLFLDEIADLPLPMQVKLLRAIQEKRVRPLGATQEIPVDVRIISASHVDLSAAVARGAFRQDLFYRINVIDLHLPPLREREGDIPLLVDHLLPRIAADSASPATGLSDAALAALSRYRFPGNVRELENILERACALCDAPLLTAADLRLPHSEPLSSTSIAPDTQPMPNDPLHERLETLEQGMLNAAWPTTEAHPEAMPSQWGLSPRSLRLRRACLG